MFEVPVNSKKSAVMDKMKSKLIFKPPMKVMGTLPPPESQRNSEKTASKQNKKHFQASISRINPPDSSKNNLQAKPTHQKKSKKRNKVECYKSLENVLLDPNKNEKLQLWRQKGDPKLSSNELVEPQQSCNELVDTVHASDDSQSSLSSVSKISVQSSPTKSCIPDSLNEACSREEDVSSKELDVSIPHSTDTGRSLRTVPVNRKKKSRMHCGHRDCTPCSKASDCGVCVQCLHKKTKK